MLFTRLDDPATIIGLLVALLVGITFHEFMHAFVADQLGDHRPRAMGRVSLNPTDHIDPVGALFFVIAGFGWGKPVQFSPYQLRSQRAGAALVGLAGPVSNFVLALLSALALRLLLSRGGTAEFTLIMLQTLVNLNVVLGVFNLVPIPPLDGSRLLSIVLPQRRQGIVYFLDQYGIFILLALLIFAPGLLSPFFDAVIRFIYRLVGFNV